jgi:hypothetical protein
MVPWEWRWTTISTRRGDGNPDLKGEGGSVKSNTVKVQCALLTLDRTRHAEWGSRALLAG